MQRFLLAEIKVDQRKDKKTMEVGLSIANEMELDHKQNISLWAGRYCLPLTISINGNQSTGQQIKFAPQALKSLGILSDQKVGIMKKDNHIHLGPVIGIMADKQEDSQRPFRDQSYFISQLINEGAKMGAVCFAFTANDIDFKNQRIQGYVYRNKSWSKGSYPFPDVIYARYKGHSLKKDDIRRKFIKAGCKFINPALMGKWRCYRLLSENLSLKEYLPDTRLIHSFQDVEDMIKKHRGVYLKPVAGSQGLYIIRVIKAGQNKYQYQYRQNSRSIKGTASDIKKLQLALKKIMGRQSYIVQEQLDLIKFKGGLADMRVLVQKNEKDQWHITGKAFRIGKSGSITSNISGGGRACTVNEILQNCIDDQDLSRIDAEIDSLALLTAQVLEKHYDPLGELGIDIGLDKNSRLWFIEANLKPARKIFSLLGAGENRLLSVQRPLLYACFLAGFEK